MAKVQEQTTELVEEQQEAQAPVILTFQMSLENVNGLIAILTKLPFGEVAGYIGSIRGQAVAQLQSMSEQKEDSTVQ